MIALHCFNPLGTTSRIRSIDAEAKTGYRACRCARNALRDDDRKGVEGFSVGGFLNIGEAKKKETSKRQSVALVLK